MSRRNWPDGADRSYSTWCEPGGGVEDGETLVGTLAREQSEETGLVLLDPVAPALVWTQEHKFLRWSRTGLLHHLVTR